MLISGSGTNLQALIDAPDIEIACVVSSRADAGGLARADTAGLPALVSADEAETLEFLDRHGAGVVVLAGYMRILSPDFVRRYSGRILNVHPSLLPSFPGLEAQRQALEHGVRVSGATVHFVPAESAELAVRVLTDAGETAWVAGELVEGDGVVLH